MRAAGGLLLGLVAAGTALAGCRKPAPPSSPGAESSTGTVIAPAAAAAAPVRTAHPVSFRDVTRSAGIDWTYHNGGTGRHLFVETTGGGVAFLDYNRDGWPDLFAVQGGTLPGEPEAADAKAWRNVLYRNNGDGTFTDVTSGSGLEGRTGYGQGVSAADYDNDGWTDLYVTAYGGNHLFRNQGNGTFTDVTRRAGVADVGVELPWPLSSAWGDFNRDGRLDLFVAHYVRWSPRLDRTCPDSAGHPSYCRPQVYEGSASRLYRANPDGTFTDVSATSGVRALIGKSMGATWLDYDVDGWPDLFVTNDTSPNFLLHNNRDGTFRDVAIVAGVAVGATGVPMSGMGIGVGDYDNDGLVDLFDVNFVSEPKGVWRNTGHGFEDRSFPSNMASSNLQFLGFGLELCDYDLDGHLDLVVGNGHVLDDPSTLGGGTTYAQSQQLFHNSGDGTFEEDLRSLGDLVRPRVTRGLAVGDYDRDGDLDVVMVAQNGPLQLFRNEGGNHHHWLQLELEGVRGARDAVGARVTGRAGAQSRTRWVSGGSSYCSSSARTLVFGLADASQLEGVEVRWPGGRVQRLGTLGADQAYRLREGGAPVRIDRPAASGGLQP